MTQHTPTATRTPLKISISKEFFSRPHGWADSDGKAEVTATFIAEGYNYTPSSETGNCADLVALIVKAVNAHEALVEALKAVRHIVQADAKRCLALVGDDEETAGKMEGAVAYIEQLDEALKLAGAQ